MNNEQTESAERDALVEKLADAVLEATEFFTARDEMNAKVHLAPTRLSPITVQCQEAVEAWRAWRFPDA